jgi:apolipoprotein N-acyltransferase
LPFIRKFVPVEGAFHEGTGPALLTIAGNSWNYRTVGNLICYEDIFPALARENVLAGADWHYVATNNAWFGEEAGAWQHAAHSVLRAVETRRPVVRCGNAGWSGWIDEYGHVRHTVTDDQGSIYFQGVDAVPLYFSNYWKGKLSFYVRNGDWFVAVCALLSLLLVVAARRQPEKA